jgi:hypothetical protein
MLFSEANLQSKQKLKVQKILNNKEEIFFRRTSLYGTFQVAKQLHVSAYILSHY